MSVIEAIIPNDAVRRQEHDNVWDAEFKPIEVRVYVHGQMFLAQRDDGPEPYKSCIKLSVKQAEALIPLLQKFVEKK